jgi:hypothetical protein
MDAPAWVVSMPMGRSDYRHVDVLEHRATLGRWGQGIVRARARHPDKAPQRDRITRPLRPVAMSKSPQDK